MTVIKWLGTTAVVLAIGTGGVIAQSQREAPQKGDDSLRAQSPSPASKDADRPADRDQRAGDRQKDNVSQSEQKGAKEPQRAEDKSAPGQKQAQEPSRDSKQPTRQSQDRPAKDDQRPSSAAQKDQDAQKDRQARQPTDQKQQQSRDERQKQTDQARDAKQPATTTQQQTQQQQPGRDQASQPSGARTGDTAQDRQRDQATDQTTRRGEQTSVNINEQQRTQMFDRLRSDRTASRNTQNLNIQVNIGQTLPARVRPRVLPPDIVRIVPQYRGYEYTMIEDEIVIVEPRTRRVVDVVSERGSARAASVGRDRVVISTEHRETLRQAARRATTGSTSPSGATMDANCLALQPVPEELVRANPQFESYRFLAVGEQIVLIDPREQKVVEVVD